MAHSKCQGINFSVLQDPHQQLHVDKAHICAVIPGQTGKPKSGSESNVGRVEVRAMWEHWRPCREADGTWRVRMEASASGKEAVG